MVMGLCNGKDTMYYNVAIIKPVQGKRFEGLKISFELGDAEVYLYGERLGTVKGGF